jgi:hypothetical protein
MQKKPIIAIIAMALTTISILSAKTSSAMEIKAEESVYIPKNQIIDGSLYASGRSVTVEGVINGDILIIANSININGDISGDIIAIGKSIEVSGKVGGNIRTISDKLDISGHIDRNLTSIANNIAIKNESTIGWDGLISGDAIDVKGTIKGRLYAYGRDIAISGIIGKNANLRTDASQSGKIDISNSASISGNLIYCCQQSINIQDESSIKGEIKPETTPQKTNKYLLATKKIIFFFLSMMIIGLVIILADKKRKVILTKDNPANIWKYVLLGMAAIIILPIISIVLAVSSIGMPLAMIIASIWLSIIISAPAMAAIYIGRNLIYRNSRGTEKKTVLILASGLAAITILSIIPYISVLFIAAILSLGFGYSMMVIKEIIW